MIADRFASVAAEHADRPAIVEPGGRVLTYEKLAGQVGGLARTIEERGIAPGDRVALLAPNGTPFATAFLGTLLAGAVPVPLNAAYGETELEYFLDVTGVRLLLAVGEVEPLCRRVLGRVEAPARLELLDAPDAAREVPLDESVRPPQRGGPIMVQFTSGSTGRPKRIERSQANLGWELDRLRETLGIRPDDRFLGVAPFSHVNGLVRSFLTSLTSGAALLPLPRFARRAVADAIAAERPTVFIGVPFHFAMLARAPNDGEPDGGSLRLCVSASAPMPIEANRAFQRRFGQPVRQLYGSTETGTISMNLDPDPTATLDTVGKPLPGVDVQVLREDGTPADPGERGEFAIRSPGMIGRYAEDDEATRASFRDGAFRIGDLGHADEEGRLTIAGRKTFFINKAGYKIDPREVERIIECHPAVEEAVVLGVPTAMGDEKVVAIVVARDAVTPAEIIDHCRGKIAPFKAPSVVELRDEIPKSPTGKVRRAMLYPS